MRWWDDEMMRWWDDEMMNDEWWMMRWWDDETDEILPLNGLSQLEIIIQAYKYNHPKSHIYIVLSHMASHQASGRSGCHEGPHIPLPYLSSHTVPQPAARRPQAAVERGDPTSRLDMWNLTPITYLTSLITASVAETTAEHTYSTGNRSPVNPQPGPDLCSYLPSQVRVIEAPCETGWTRDTESRNSAGRLW
jgi:hypothetical protein